jgi:hypothetical protein
MCEGLISGWAAFEASDVKFIATNTSDSLFIFFLTRKEISHGMVSWQTRCSYFAMGPLASSFG